MDASPTDFSLTSMTGFAARQGAGHGWTWTVDMRSVNGRGLDLRFRLPDWIEGLEPELRKSLQADLKRGSVTVGIRLQRDDTAAAGTLNTDNLTGAISVLSEIEGAASVAGLALAKTSAADIAAIKGVLDQSDAAAADTAALRKDILETSAICLAALVADREREGRAIASVIADQIERLSDLLDQAEAAIGDRDAQARAAMDRALSRLLDATEVPDETRLLQELALIAVKNDVTEEIDRLKAHVGEALNLMRQQEPVGRKFDFLMQEFNREANTLCSKSQSSALTGVGLDLKALIDQMREQVQNIE